MELGWTDNWQEKLKVLEEMVFLCYYAHRRFYTDCPAIEPRLPRWMYTVPAAVSLESRRMFIIITVTSFPELGAFLNLRPSPVFEERLSGLRMTWYDWMEIGVAIDCFIIWPIRRPFRSERTESWCRAKLCVKWELSTSSVVVLLISRGEESPLLLLVHPYSLWHRSASRPIPRSLWWTFVMTSYSQNQVWYVNCYMSCNWIAQQVGVAVTL